MKRAFLIAASLLAMMTAARADDPIIPKFANESATSGINSVYKGDWQYMVGGGVAAFDCNGDGFPELFLAGGENKATSLRGVGK